MKSQDNVSTLKVHKDTCIFSAFDLITFLKNIDELNGYSIELRQSFNGNMQIKIDDSVYVILDDTQCILV